MTAIPFLEQLVKLPPDRWRVSVNNTSKGPVTSHDLGVQEGSAWVTFGYLIDGTPHQLRGEVDVVGSQRVILDGMQLENGTIILSNRVCGLSIRVVIELKFTRGGEPIRYRFDGRLT